jgi:hypothetical protein
VRRVGVKGMRMIVFDKKCEIFPCRMIGACFAFSIGGLINMMEMITKVITLGIENID